MGLRRPGQYPAYSSSAFDITVAVERKFRALGLAERKRFEPPVSIRTAAQLDHSPRELIAGLKSYV
jgi:hypothetical protein